MKTDLLRKPLALLRRLGFLRHAMGFDALSTRLDMLDRGVSATLQRLDRIEQEIQNFIAFTSFHLDRLERSTSLVARAQKQTGKRIRAVFLVHSIETWDALGDVFEAMRKDSRFDPIAISIDRRYPGQNRPSGEEKTSQELDRISVPHLRFGMENSFEGLDMLRALSPDIIFRQSQWDDDYPPAFSTPCLSFSKLCVVPYGISIVKHFKIDGSDGEFEKNFDQYYHRIAWRIFCETPFSRNRYLNLKHGVEEKYILTGYPKLPRILRGREAPVWPLQSSGSTKKLRVIWAPHHSIDGKWLGFGVFPSMMWKMLAFVKKNPDRFEWVLRPHPALFTLAVSIGAVSAEEMKRFIREWFECGNCMIDTGGNYGPLFAASDIMVTDGVSFLTEYPLFDKPLIFIDSGTHVPVNETGDASIDCAITVRDFSGIEAELNRFEATRIEADPSIVEKRQRLKAIVMPTSANPADLIIENIASSV
jgi:hypothetical protein